MNTSCFKTLAIVLTFWSKAIVRGYPLISEVDSGAEKVCYGGLITVKLLGGITCHS